MFELIIANEKSCVISYLCYWTSRSGSAKCPLLLGWGSFDKWVTKQRHSVSFPTIKNPKYTFCKEFNSE